MPLNMFIFLILQNEKLVSLLYLNTLNCVASNVENSHTQYICHNVLWQHSRLRRLYLFLILLGLRFLQCSSNGLMELSTPAAGEKDA